MTVFLLINVVGKGYSGVVYRVETGTGMKIAVKKLWPLKNEESSSERDLFIAEIKTLGLIWHRNIIRLLGFCTNAHTRLLMYKIILGVAQGLAYLHHDCSLDFEAYVADFGLAKHVDPSELTKSSNTVAGTYGSIAPVPVNQAQMDPLPNFRVTSSAMMLEWKPRSKPTHLRAQFLNSLTSQTELSTTLVFKF
ncbi:hypothetical protein EJ110_NYTH35417 [Nymphaea thermarum]|nr:hypothetical protein EJ110_NYTH35417 [Nymphaea thermarum]